MGTLRKTRNVYNSLVEEVKALSLPPLGGEFKQLHGTRLKDALVAHRLTAKYQVPSKGDANERKMKSIRAVLENDNEGMIDFKPIDLPGTTRKNIFNDRGVLQASSTAPTGHRYTFFKAREFLNSMFKDFRPTYRFRSPTGETYVASGGLTDLLYKLRKEDQWCISPDLLDFATKIVMSNVCLKRVVKARFRAKHGDKGAEHLARLREAWVTTNDFKFLHGQKDIYFPFEAMKEQLKMCCTFVRSSRVTTVPKDNSNDRVISCEPLWNMICQLSFAQDLRDSLFKHTGIDLDSWQRVHAAVIRSGAATIDFSRASDTNYVCVLRELFPARVFKHLETLRSGIFEYVEGDETKYHALRMFAPMGCGVTFEVLTLTLLAYGRAISPSATVFGDDVIIDQASAAQFVDFTTSLGWVVNDTKSFLNGNFRESCGAFADLSADELLTSYDFWYPENISDVYINANKLRVLIRSLPKTSSVRPLLLKCYVELHFLLPRDSWWDIGNDYKGDDLSESIFYTPMASHRPDRNTAVSEQISVHWQRPVFLGRVSRTISHARSIKVANATVVACYFRRGRSYVPSHPKDRCVDVPCDMQTGTPVNGVLLATVL